jgi:hypothetical protein
MCCFWSSPTGLWSPCRADVGGLEHRISEKADRGALAVLPGLVLPLGHAVEPAHARGAFEQPGQLGMGGDRAVREQDGFLRIDRWRSAPLPFRERSSVAAQVDLDGQGMKVGEEEQALRLILHPHPA